MGVIPGLLDHWHSPSRFDMNVLVVPDLMATTFHLDRKHAVLGMKNQKINFPRWRTCRRPATCHIRQPRDAVHHYKVV